METTHQPSPNDPPRHEEIDVRARGFLYFLLIFIGVAIILHLVLYWMYGALARRLPQEEISPLADTAPVPPAPRLQGSVVHPTPDWQDMEKLRAREDKILNGYGWTDREAGRVRIPINRAMELVVQRGLPTSRPTTQPETQGGRS